MSKQLPGRASQPDDSTTDVAEKLRRSRQRLLDLTLRNRLLNFKPGNPEYRDDLKAHKHIVLKGHVESVWQTLVEDEKEIEVVGLTREQQAQIAQELRLQSKGNQGSGAGGPLSLASLRHDDWEDLRGSIRGVSQFLQRGNLLSLLPEEAFRKRLTKIRNEQNTLANSTGDSALFIAMGFLQWCEPEPHPKANEPLFAPLVLVHVNLEQRRTDDGGEREFYLRMDADQPQGNPCIAEKLRQDFELDLPELEEDETASTYFSRVSRALRTKKNWKVVPTIALGFFNFARYRLWLDLNPNEWPAGQSPTTHPIVSSILNGDPLPQREGIPDDEEVARHQETEDLPIVMDADSTQYAALLASKKSVSMVIQGPPGSGKSQTITNLIAIAVAHGMRVLFVAQKLPALQVVQRRLESVELGPFCLPLFSDKARVTEMHKHFATSARLRENPEWSRTYGNSVTATAQKLNGHASRLRNEPTGFNQTACSLIQRATALHLMLRESWGSEWNDELLSVTVLDVEAPPEWTEKREQTLHQWHRLKAEVGNSWSHWSPLKLGPMDTQDIEAVVARQERAALELAEHLQCLPEEFHNLTIGQIEQGVARLKSSRFTVLENVLPNLLAFLWQTLENAPAVARLERDLEEFHRQLTRALRHLRITDDNRSYVAESATEALAAIGAFVSPRCSLDEAKSNLLELNDVVRWADDLVAYANLHSSGVIALEASGSEGGPLSWKHIEVLSNHGLSDRLQLPAGSKVSLARYVFEDAGKKNEARVFAQRLARFHERLDRLSARVISLGRFQQGTTPKQLDTAISVLSSHGFADIRICDLAELKSALNRTLKLFEDVVTKTPADLPPTAFGHQTLSFGDVKQLANLKEIPLGVREPPKTETRGVLTRLLNKPEPVSILRSFISSVAAYQKACEELGLAFPEIRRGQPVPKELLESQREIVRLISELGLDKQSLESLSLLRETTERLRRTCEATAQILTRHFEKWPILPPDSLGELQEVKILLLLLVNRPASAKEISSVALCVQANSEAVLAAIEEGKNLVSFRNNRAERVAFRDLPDPDAVVRLRRDLRSAAGYWWRWFSSRYRKTRRETRAFLKPPFPSDEDLVVLLEEIETHERQRVTFQSSAAGTLLGSCFHGIDTQWQPIEATLAWISELKAATQAGDVSPFVEASIAAPDALREAIKLIDLFAQGVDQQRGELSRLAPLSFLASDPKSIKIKDVAAALNRVEGLLKRLIAYAQPHANRTPDLSCKELSSRIGELERLEKVFAELGAYEEVAPPELAGNLTTASLEQDAAWLEMLIGRGVAPKLLDGMLTGAFDQEAHAPLLQLAQAASQEFLGLSERFLSDHSLWCVDEAACVAIEASLRSNIECCERAEAEAREWTFVTELTVFEVREALADANDIAIDVADLSQWKSVFGEEPSHLRQEQITSTLDWLETLRQHGAAGSLLKWILEEETDNRVHWWQQLVGRSKDLCNKARRLQESFAMPLYDRESPSALIVWSSQVADRSAKTISALEVIESHSQSGDFAVHDLAQATASLRRAIELDGALEGWRDRLGVAATKLAVVTVQSHRQWAAIARGLATPLGNWLAASDTTARCQTLVSTEAKLNAIKKALKETQDILEFFGRVWGDGPFEVLSTKCTARDIEQHCRAFVARIPVLPNYAALLREEESARKLGLASLIKHGANARISTNVLIDTFRGAVAYQQAKAIWESDDELRYFQSNEHDRLRQKFQGDDERQLKANRRFIKSRLGNSGVTEGARGRTAGEHTEYALLQHEMGKQRRHLPIRKLVHRAGRAMQDLCPCWMMTPLAVAQFLAPGAISFDLVIMDEASQINPEDAWGAIARGTQLIVVGDQKQMPPSDFFMSALEEDESPEDDDEIDGGKSESILDASVASLLSSPLLWHYRSRQETLIAPANSFSYDNRLILFPHPHRKHPELGIRYAFVENATTTTGKVTNAREAEAVARRVRELVLREYAKPAADRLTIGVVAMNLHQQDCIWDLLDRMREEDRRFDLAMAALSSEHHEEPLFIRNLENIQGDERDIMIVSCTYGPHTPGGTPTQRFGPLNREGGERRFNVLITRAKWRMEIFASLRSDQIVVDGKRQGIRDFHLFLKYAESGILVDRGETTGKSPDSPFELQVEAVLRKSGFETERQVGVAGYFIDLAVKHPHHPGLFALGIECDGKTYHSSRAARDRDRLREKVLMDRGWKLHRIWSTDWFVNPQQAKKRLIDAVSIACR